MAEKATKKQKERKAWPYVQRIYPRANEKKKRVEKMKSEREKAGKKTSGPIEGDGGRRRRTIRRVNSDFIFVSPRAIRERALDAALSEKRAFSAGSSSERGISKVAS